jgi:predicted Zn-dependent protease
MMKAKLVGFIGPANRVASRYPPSDQSLPAKYARAIAAYRAVDIKAALTLVDELISIEPSNPYFHELKGQILFESGRAAESVPDASQVSGACAAARPSEGEPRPVADRDQEDANIEEAEGLLMDALALEHDNAFAWNQLAVVYAKPGPDRRCRPRDG